MLYHRRRRELSQAVDHGLPRHGPQRHNRRLKVEMDLQLRPRRFLSDHGLGRLVDLA